jgi:hypothetical protein
VGGSPPFSPGRTRYYSPVRRIVRGCRAGVASVTADVHSARLGLVVIMRREPPGLDFAPTHVGWTSFRGPTQGSNPGQRLRRGNQLRRPTLILPARLSIPTRLSASPIYYRFTTTTPDSDAKQSHQSQIDISLVQYRKGRNTGVSLIHIQPLHFGPVSSRPRNGTREDWCCNTPSGDLAAAISAQRRLLNVRCDRLANSACACNLQTQGPGAPRFPRGFFSASHDCNVGRQAH